MSDKELMRECVTIKFAAADSGAKNALFDIDIPEHMAMELDSVEFIHAVGASPVPNRVKYYLVDDPDETADPDHTAEKVIQSCEYNNSFDTEGRSQGFTLIRLDCGKTLVVRSPNFVAQVDNVFGADTWLNARIWFDFVKVSPTRIVEIMRQQMY